MKDINAKTVLDEETSQFYYEGLADYTKYKGSNVAHYLDELSRPNLLINGDFQVWQRGEEFIINDNSSIYTADRHRLSLSNIGDHNKVTRTQNGFKLETTQVIPGANRYLCYQMEKNDLEKIKGKEVTFSIRVRKLTKASKVHLTIFGNFEAESWKTISLNNTEFETYTFTYLFKTDILEKSVLYTLDNSSTEIGGGFEVQYIKLELGSFSTSVYSRSYAEELVMCQRYYIAKPHTPNAAVCIEYFGGASKFASIPFVSEMRTTPKLDRLSAYLADGKTSIADKLLIENICTQNTGMFAFQETNSPYIFISYALDAEIY